MQVISSLIILWIPTKFSWMRASCRFIFLQSGFESKKMLVMMFFCFDFCFASPKEDLKIICDTPAQYKEWSTTLKELAKMFETTPRDGIETREVTFVVYVFFFFFFMLVCFRLLSSVCKWL
jgi:hypothetical protein